MRRFLVLLLALLPTVLIAQVDPGTCPTCYDNYVDDRSFHIGGHQISDDSAARERFHMSFSQNYIGDAYHISEVLATPTNVIWIESDTVPWGGYWNDTVLDPSRRKEMIVFSDTDSTSEVRAITRHLNRQAYLRALEHGTKIVYHPYPIYDIMKGASAWESYLTSPYRVKEYLLCYKQPIEANTGDQLAAWRRAYRDSLAGGLFWVYGVGALLGDTIPTNDTTTLLAARPDYLGNGFVADYESLYGIASLPDDRKKMSFGVAINTDVAHLSNDSIPDNSVIAYTDLFIRETLYNGDLDTLYVFNGSGQITDTIIDDPDLRQDTCGCRIMRRWKRIEITKEGFLERYDFSSTENERYVAHKDGFLTTDPDGPDHWYYDLDTLIDFSPVWDTLTSSKAGAWGDTLHRVWNADSLRWDTLAYRNCTPAYTAFVARRQALSESTYYVSYRDSIDSVEVSPGNWTYDTTTVKKWNQARLNSLDYNERQWVDAGETFNLKFYATGVVPINFLRTRIATPHFVNLREGRYDSLITRAVKGVFADPLVDSLTGRIGVGDETEAANFRAWGMLSAKAQRAMAADSIGSLRPKPIWSNPTLDFDAYRLYSGDLDTTAFKLIHVAARQSYRFTGGKPTPVFYTNPDSLGIEAWDTTYAGALKKDIIVNGNTIRPRDVSGNSEIDHGIYTETVQGTFGKFAQRNNTNFPGAVPEVAWAVDAMQLRFRDRFPHIPSVPVWNVVQTHGWMNTRPEVGKPCYNETCSKIFVSTRTTTPEEIIASAWLTMNTGATGVIFGDLNLDAANTGVMTGFIVDPTVYDTLEYGQHRTTNFYGNADMFPENTIDSMWLGLRSRRAAIAEVTRELTYIDSVIGWDNLDYRLEQMSVYDTDRTFADVPMLRWLGTEQADRYDISSDSTGAPVFAGTGTFDARDKTFAEVTHFRMKTDSSSRIVLITNRRTWPIDTLTYGDSARNRFARFAPYTPFDTIGLGAIDVRRSHIILEYSGDHLVDSMVIERISPTAGWTRMAAVGDTIELDWMLPGRGQMYKLTPIQSFISDHGTAYNNAVHSENPSTDSTSLDRLVVYERDSVVYLRSVDPSGGWSREVMISSPSDTVLVSGQRRASNFFPAIAVARSGEKYTRIVWERDSANVTRSIHSVLIRTDSIDVNTFDQLLADSLVYRQRISPIGTWGVSRAMTPSIVAVHDDSGEAGFVISFADKVKGVNVVAIREQTSTDHKTSIASFDTAIARQVRFNTAMDVFAQYPTLANVPRDDSANFRTTQRVAISGTTALPDTLNNHLMTLLHLAYQQGDGVDGSGEEIYYNPVAVSFPTADTLKPGLWVGLTEHVSEGLTACSFEHPSIAADSVRVGVAFEWVGQSNRQIALRFRDKSGIDGVTQLPTWDWKTSLYVWGGVLKRNGRFVQPAAAYARPSLTHFPAIHDEVLLNRAEGGLVWYRIDGPNGRAHPQFIYRYGWPQADSMEDGKHPSLTLVPLKKSNPMLSSSVLHRGSDSLRVHGLNSESESVWYYTGRLLNSPSAPLPPLFGLTTHKGGIIAAGNAGDLLIGCAPAKISYGILFDKVQIGHHGDAVDVPGDTTIIGTAPDLPRSFFEAPVSGTTRIDTLPENMDVVRTSLFVADDDVEIRRIVMADTGVTTWLNSFGWDSERSTEPNIWTTVELVRNADHAVLWRSDTVSARGLDTLDDPVDDLVQIPVDDVTDSGTVVFVRIRAFASSTIALTPSAEFLFFSEDSTTGPAPKRALRPERGESRESEAAALSLSVIPNPARDRAELSVWTAEPGTIRVTVWSATGEMIGELPTIEAGEMGTYAIEVDLRDVRPGSYLIRAESASVSATATITVMR